MEKVLASAGGDSALEDVKTAFANSPVTNPDGLTGVKLHYVFDENTGSHHILDLASTFYDIKTNYFGTPSEREYSQNAVAESNYLVAKWQIFHYAVYGDSQSPIFGGSSGRGELTGNDFEITLAGDASISDQEGTIMHELGHNLGLDHGGNVGDNCKPNYLSVMNYLFQFKDIVGNRPLDYSRSNLTSLNEADLSEPAGVGTSTPPGLTTAYGSNSSSINTAATGGAIDWNGNHISTNLHVVENVDKAASKCNDSSFTVLTGYNDWPSLVYDFRDKNPGNFANGEANAGQLPIEQTLEMVKQTKVYMINRLDIAIQTMDDPSFVKMQSPAASRTYFHNSLALIATLVQNGDSQGTLQALMQLRTSADSSSSNSLLVSSTTQRTIFAALDDRIISLKSDLNLP